MRRLHDLDEEIARVVRRVARRREALAQDLTVVRASAKDLVASPVVLGTALVAGFLLERLVGSGRPRAPEVPHKAGAVGLAAALAMALMRAAMNNASVWAGPLFHRWAERRREHAQARWAERELPPARERGPGVAAVEDRSATLH